MAKVSHEEVAMETFSKSGQDPAVNRRNCCEKVPIYQLSIHECDSVHMWLYQWKCNLYDKLVPHNLVPEHPEGQSFKNSWMEREITTMSWLAVTRNSPVSTFFSPFSFRCFSSKLLVFFCRAWSLNKARKAIQKTTKLYFFNKRISGPKLIIQGPPLESNWTTESQSWKEP